MQQQQGGREGSRDAEIKLAHGFSGHGKLSGSKNGFYPGSLRGMGME